MTNDMKSRIAKKVEEKHYVDGVWLNPEKEAVKKLITPENYPVLFKGIELQEKYPEYLGLENTKIRFTMTYNSRFIVYNGMEITLPFSYPNRGQQGLTFEYVWYMSEERSKIRNLYGENPSERLTDALLALFTEVRRRVEYRKTLDDLLSKCTSTSDIISAVPEAAEAIDEIIVEDAKNATYKD